MAPTRWSNTEQAYLLNYLDYCLENDKDFRSSAPGDISRFAKRELSFAAVNHKLSTLVKDNGRWTSLSAIISNGTSQLDLAALPPAILSAMKTQRSSLGLGDLDADTTAKEHRSETLAQEPENTNTAHTQRRPNTRERNTSQNSYGEEGVADTANSDDTDDSDGDFSSAQKIKPKLIIHGPKKHTAAASRAPRRAVSHTKTVPPDERAHNTAAKRKSQHIDPDGPQPSSKRQALESNVSLPSSSSAVSTVPKRKADVVVLEGNESPPPKRQARDTARAASPLKASGIRPAVKRNQRGATHQRQSSPVAQKNDAVHALTSGPQSLAPLATHQAPSRTTKIVQQPKPVQTKQPARQPVPAKAQQTQAPAPQPMPGTSNREAIPGNVSSNPARVAATYMNPKPVEVPVTSGDTALKLCQDLTHLVGMLVYEHASSGGEMDEDVAERLKCIQRYMEKEPGSLYGRLLKDLHSQEVQVKKFRNLLFGLIDQLEFNGRNKDFPRVPWAEDLQEGWKKLRNDIRDAFGMECTAPIPEVVDTGYIARCIEDLTKDGGVPLVEVKDYLDELAPHLKSPHMVQSILSALVCHWLFRTPDPMCEGLYSEKELRSYEAILRGKDPKKPWEEGPKDVQKLDKMGLKLTFKEEDFDKTTVRVTAEQLVAKSKRALAQAYPSAPGFWQREPQLWTQTAFKFKQSLMISPKDCRVHFPFPGTPFDPTWMKAEEFDGFDLNDEKASSKKVACCLFPALFEKDTEPFGENVTVEELLTSNKKFFPSFKERQSLDPKRVIGKATVLVL